MQNQPSLNRLITIEYKQSSKNKKILKQTESFYPFEGAKLPNTGRKHFYLRELPNKNRKFIGKMFETLHERNKIGNYKRIKVIRLCSDNKILFLRLTEHVVYPTINYKTVHGGLPYEAK